LIIAERRESAKGNAMSYAKGRPSLGAERFVYSKQVILRGETGFSEGARPG